MGTSQQKQHEMRPSGEDQSQRFLRKFPCVICADVTHYSTYPVLCVKWHECKHEMTCGFEGIFTSLA